MICPNTKCVGGYVRKFKARTEKEKAIFYDELCEVCGGEFDRSDDDEPEELDEHWGYQDDRNSDEPGDDCPF